MSQYISHHLNEIFYLQIIRNASKTTKLLSSKVTETAIAHESEKGEQQIEAVIPEAETFSGISCEIPTEHVNRNFDHLEGTSAQHEENYKDKYYEKLTECKNLRRQVRRLIRRRRLPAKKGVQVNIKIIYYIK